MLTLSHIGLRFLYFVKRQNIKVNHLTVLCSFISMFEPQIPTDLPPVGRENVQI